MDKSRNQRHTNPLEAELKKGVALGVPAEELLGWVRKALEKDQRDLSGTKIKHKDKDIIASGGKRQQHKTKVGEPSSSFSASEKDRRTHDDKLGDGNRATTNRDLATATGVHNGNSSGQDRNSSPSPTTAAVPATTSSSLFIEIESLKLLVERVRELSSADNDDGEGKQRRREGNSAANTGTCSDDDDDDDENGYEHEETDEAKREGEGELRHGGSSSSNPSPRSNQAGDDSALSSSRESSSVTGSFRGKKNNVRGKKNNVVGNGGASLRLVAFSSPNDEHNVNPDTNTASSSTGAAGGKRRDRGFEKKVGIQIALGGVNPPLPQSASDSSASPATTTTVQLTSASSIDLAVKLIHDHLTLQGLKEKGLRALLKSAKKATAKANAESAALRKIANAHEEEKESLRRELTFAQNRFFEANQQLERLALETVASTRFSGNILGGGELELVGGEATTAERTMNKFKGMGEKNNALHQSLPRGEETQLLLEAVERALETIMAERQQDSHHHHLAINDVASLHSDSEISARASEFNLLKPNTTCASPLMNINKASEERTTPTIFTFSRTSSNQRGLIGRAQNVTANSQTNGDTTNTCNNDTIIANVGATCSSQHQRQNNFTLSKLQLPNDVQSPKDYGGDATADAFLEASSSSAASALLGTARPTFSSIVIPGPFYPQSGGEKERGSPTPPAESTMHRRGDSLLSGHRPLNGNQMNSQIRTRSGIASFSRFSPRNTTHPSTPSAHVASGGGATIRSNSNTNIANINAVLLHDLRKKVAELTKANEKLKSRCDRLSAHNKALSNAAMHHHDQLSQHRTFANRIGHELQETLTSTDDTLKKKIKKIEMLETEIIPSLKIGQKRLEDQIGSLEKALRAAHAQLYAAEINREAERESTSALIAKLQEEKAALELTIVKKQVAGAAVPSSRKTFLVLGSNTHDTGGSGDKSDPPNAGKTIMSIKQQLKLFLDEGRADDANNKDEEAFVGLGVRQGREAAVKSTDSVKERGILHFSANSESDAVRNRVVLPPITLPKANTFSGGGVGVCSGESTDSPSRWEALVADLKNDIKKDQMAGIKSRGPPRRR